jgi:glycosyltransferase involved in cell wall biosynthesis
MLITVGICTLNRAESLRRTLASLAAMRLQNELKWEVVVVNNNCTDHTDAVIESFVDRLPIRRKFEPQRGLSRARNRAVDTAEGNYIVWTDDDVVVDPGWLTAYAESFHRWPEATVFGGPIMPRYSEPVPRWLAGNEVMVGEMAFSRRDLGDEPISLSVAGNRIPYGPNFALRTSAQRAFPYDPQLGHAPGQQRRCEEFDVIDRILGSGGSGYWVPQARVEHCINHEQQTVGYVRDFLATCGEGIAFRSGVATSGPIWCGAPRWIWRQTAEEWLLYRIHQLVSPPRVWLRHLYGYAVNRGQIRYLLRHRA